MPADIGSQIITLKFFDPVDSYVVNRLAKEVRNLGVYSGGYLTRVSDISVTLSPLVCEIGDGTYQVRAETGSTVTVAVSTLLPYIVLRWVYTASASTDYMDFVAVALGSITSTDIVVGKCIFAGSTLTGFDYALRTNPLNANLFLKCQALATPAMKVKIRAGRVSYGNSNFDIVLQDSPTFTAPTSNSRIDLIQINSSGVIVVTQGVTAASPVPPNYDGKVTLAEVTLAVGQTTILNSNIKDVRGFVSMATGNAVLTSGNQTVAGIKTFTSQVALQGGADFNKQQAVNLAIENRTSDPATPATGQIWLRTDL